MALPRLGIHQESMPWCPVALAGLTIFCAVPTTLGVGVALVRSCRGNDGVALLMTVGTNLLGVVSGGWCWCVVWQLCGARCVAEGWLITLNGGLH